MKTKIILIALILQFSFTGTPLAAEQLTLNQCIETALAKHPDLIAASARVDSRKAGIGQAEAGGRPQVNAGASYTRSDGSAMRGAAGSYSTNITAEQSVYDWGRRSLKVSGAKLDKDAAEADRIAARDKVIADVRSAYYGLNRSLRQQKIAQSRYDNYKKRLSWAKSFYEVGTKARIEVTKAEADLANSKLLLVKASSASEQFKAQLASAMGDPRLDVEDVQDVLAYEDWNVPLDAAVSRAIANRAELIAQQKRVERARTALELERKGLSPGISASAGYSLYGSAPFDENGWNAKISLNIPLIDGGLTKSRVAAAEADLTAAAAQMESLSNAVVLEVRKSWQSLREAKEALIASQESERQAKATYELAEGRYAAGVGSSLEISDALDSYAAAQANTVLSLYECKQSGLELEKAIGGLK